MQVIQQNKNEYMLRVESGKELKSELMLWAEKTGIESGYVSAIGACQRATLGRFLTESNEYEWYELDKQLELVSLTGNLGVKDDELMLHIHAVLSGEEGKTVAGHLKEFVVRPTCEVYFRAFKTPIQRSADPKTGLDLIDGEEV
jgi:hypothetical protein